VSFPEPFFRWRPHPWHGLSVGDDPPGTVNAFIEITPFDLVKYEVDKGTGYLRVDRPQRSSSQPPALYGFIPQTYCGTRVRDLMPGASRGDGDPLDVCVLSERQVTRSEVIIPARVVGGLPMLDGGEADDKIIAILVNDPAWSHVQQLADLPDVLVERLRHYFLTYKLVPGQSSDVSIEHAYSREHAITVIEAAMADYEERYGGDR
jgi:inorganic pyrophosphatase